jgi:ribosomal protein S20
LKKKTLLKKTKMNTRRIENASYRSNINTYIKSSVPSFAEESHNTRTANTEVTN